MVYGHRAEREPPATGVCMGYLLLAAAAPARISSLLFSFLFSSSFNIFIFPHLLATTDEDAAEGAQQQHGFFCCSESPPASPYHSSPSPPPSLNPEQ